ncbi:MAG: hypothetical protein HN337_03305 [Deltaproteobacteria bacterium]|nr:hypothetical protein [Deltaproteobacteria bacterium]
MSMGMQLAFGLINFILFFALLYLILKPIAREFFYARRERIKKDIAQSAWKLRRASQHYKEARSEYDNLTNDIESRKKAISIDCEKECGAIIKEAEYRRDYLIMGARKIAEEEIKESSGAIKDRLVKTAIDRASVKLSSGAHEAANKSAIKKGLGDLAAEIASGAFKKIGINSRDEASIP